MDNIIQHCVAYFKTYCKNCGELTKARNIRIGKLNTATITYRCSKGHYWSKKIYPDEVVTTIGS